MTDDPETDYDVSDERPDPVLGPSATCPDCGSQLLGRGTLAHHDDGSHTFETLDGGATWTYTPPNDIEPDE